MARIEDHRPQDDVAEAPADEDEIRRRAGQPAAAPARRAAAPDDGRDQGSPGADLARGEEPAEPNEPG